MPVKRFLGVTLAALLALIVRMNPSLEELQAAARLGVVPFITKLARGCRLWYGGMLVNRMLEYAAFASEKLDRATRIGLIDLLDITASSIVTFRDQAMLTVDLFSTVTFRDQAMLAVDIFFSTIVGGLRVCSTTLTLFEETLDPTTARIVTCVFALTILYSAAISTWALLRLVFRIITTLGNLFIRVLAALADFLVLVLGTPRFLMQGLLHVQRFPPHTSAFE